MLLKIDKGKVRVIKEVMSISNAHKSADIVIVFISLSLYLILNFFLLNVLNSFQVFSSKIPSKTIYEKQTENITTSTDNSIEDVKEASEEDIQEIESGQYENIQNIIEKDNMIWRIEIPIIGVSAPIAEGTTNEIMDQYVGHFDTTSKLDGNIGLIAHNRGYPVNYFRDLKTLNIGDEVIYFYGNVTKKYTVNLITVIDDTDWSYLEKTEENKITLITCVENQPQYRRCIQGVETR